MTGTNMGDSKAPASLGPGSGGDAERKAPHAEAAEPGDRPRKPVRRRGRWRTPVAALLIILGCVLAPLSVVGVWTANQVSDTSRYVANVEPLIHDPAIQNALTDKITSEIVTRINVKGLTDQAAAALAQKGLPRISTLLQSFSGSLASGVQGFVHSSIHKIITGPRMANAWVQVNRVASQALVAVLSGSGGKNGAVGVSNGQVTLDLAPLIAVAKWTYAHRTALRIGAVALAALIFVFWGQPTVVVVIVIAVLLLIVLGLIEVIGRPPAQPEAAAHP